MRLLIIATALACMFVSCKKSAKNNSLANAQFAFGVSGNFCAGDCATFYAIENGKLYPDAITRYTTGTVSFSTTALPNDKYLLAKQLLDSFPAFLLTNVDTTFGCPDCADGGAIHIWRNINGTVRSWDIDNVVENNPTEIQPYIKKLQTIVGEL